jgi:hypothetical protein
VTTAAPLWLYLITQDVQRRTSNPYAGILSFIVLPFIFFGGLLLIPIGAYLSNRRIEASLSEPRHMETESFCGQSCHVMAPEFRAHQVSPHSKVACVDCHVVPGADGWLHARMNGTRQLIEVVLNSYPRPIPSAIESNRLVASTSRCENCHATSQAAGPKLRILTSFKEDEANTATHTVLMRRVGGDSRLPFRTRRLSRIRSGRRQTTDRSLG